VVKSTYILNIGVWEKQSGKTELQIIYNQEYNLHSSFEVTTLLDINRREIKGSHEDIHFIAIDLYVLVMVI